MTSDRTPAEDRPISPSEAAAVAWLLCHAGGENERLVPGVPALRVVGRCACGCATVDFVRDGGGSHARILADALGRDREGRICGLILRGRADAVTSLEIYELEPGSATEVPAVDTLFGWESYSEDAAPPA